MKFKQIKEEFGSLKGSAERLQSLVSNYSNAMQELCRTSGELVKGIQEYYKETPITLVGDVMIPRLVEGLRTQENTILPVVKELNLELSTVIKSYNQAFRYFQSHINRVEGLKQDFMKIQDKWKKTRNRSFSTERLQKRGEAMFGAEDEYKLEKSRLEEELACFRLQKTDYFDHIGISVLSSMYLLDSTKEKKEKHHVIDALETILAENVKSLGTFDSSLNVLSTNVVEKIQKNSLLKRSFRDFLVKERSEENLDFLTDIDKMRTQIDQSNREKLALEIYLHYIEKGKVNIPWSIRVKVTESVANQNFSPSMFDECKTEITNLLKSDSLERFFKSPYFGQLKMRTASLCMEAMSPIVSLRKTSSDHSLLKSFRSKNKQESLKRNKSEESDVQTKINCSQSGKRTINTYGTLRLPKSTAKVFTSEASELVL